MKVTEIDGVAVEKSGAKCMWVFSRERVKLWKEKENK
jgi:hypothetical protein